MSYFLRREEALSLAERPLSFNIRTKSVKHRCSINGCTVPDSGTSVAGGREAPYLALWEGIYTRWVASHHTREGTMRLRVPLS